MLKLLLKCISSGMDSHGSNKTHINSMIDTMNGTVSDIDQVEGLMLRVEFDDNFLYVNRDSLKPFFPFRIFPFWY